MRTIDVALTQLGVKEATGHNDGVPAVRYNRGDEVNWCAAFVEYCNAHSDDPKLATTDKDYYAQRRVQTMEDETKRRGWWLPPETVPQPNDVVFFGDRGGSDPGVGRHVGIVETVTTNPLVMPPLFTSIEGNWGNAVQRVKHDLAEAKEAARVTGYARFPAT